MVLHHHEQCLMVLLWNSLKQMPLFHLALMGGILQAAFSLTYSGFTPFGTPITSKGSGSRKRAKVFRPTFLPASSSLLTTQCGVASREPPEWICMDSPNWKASISVGMLILATSANLFLANRPPVLRGNLISSPFSSVQRAEVRAVSEPWSLCQPHQSSSASPLFSKGKQ